MNKLALLLSVLLLSACGNAIENPFSGGALHPDTTDSATYVQAPSFDKAKTYRFYIPAEFNSGAASNLDTLLTTNHLTISQNLEAKKYALANGKELVAINNVFLEDSCLQYQPYIVTRNTDGDFVDLTSSIFPELDIFAFYDYDSKLFKRFQNNTGLVFAGYQLDFSKTDSLGVQFMFCDNNDTINKSRVNEQGVILYTLINELN